jgi:hypothetical protein
MRHPFIPLPRVPRSPLVVALAGSTAAKRGVVEASHKASKRYLHLYVAEFQFRYNNRNNYEIFGTTIEGC